nr:hypothetical protein [Tanacetum cinerariifolium]
MDNRKRIVNLEYFKEMMHICPRLPSQKFNDLPFEEEILAFLRFLGHSRKIRKLTDILWGLYHKKNVDFAYLLWKDFNYQVEHKDAKNSNEMHYLRFTKVIIHNFMTKDPSIPRRNKVNWHYVRYDQMFTKIKLVSRHQNTQQFGVMLPIELTNEDITNSEAYKKYYAVASGAAPPKTKASIRKTKSNEGTGIIPEVPNVPTKDSGEEISWKSSDEDDDVDEGSDDQDDDDDQDTDEEGEEFIHPKLSIHDEEETKDEESFDPITKTRENSYDEGNDDENIGLNVGNKEGHDAEDDENELYRDVNINLEGRVVQMADVHTTQEFEDTRVTLTLVNPDGQQQSSSIPSQFVTSMLNPTPDAGINSLFETTSQMDVSAPTTVASLTLSTPTLTPSTIPTISTVPQAPTPPKTAPSTLLQDLPNFGSLFGFDHRLKTLEANFSEFVQTNQFAGAVSSILGIVQRYTDQRMNEAGKVAVQIQSDRLRDEAQAENEEFLKNFDENIQKIIKEQVKEQVNVQVSKILPKIEKTVNEQLEDEVLTWSTNSSKTSYVVAAYLSKMELKKILIEKMESNKSIHRSDEQRNLCKALVEAYESDKIILDTYGDIVTLKRRRDDADKDKEPSAGSDRGSKRRKEGKDPKSTSAPKEKATRTTGKSTRGSKSQQKTASESVPAEEPMQTTHDLVEPSHQEFKTSATDDQPIAEASQHPEWFQKQKKPPTLDRQQYPHNLLKPLSLIPNSQSRRVIPFDHFINNDLEYLCGGAFSRKYTTSVAKTKAAYYGHIKWIEDLVPCTMWSQEPVSYDKHALWHNYKHLDWITVRRDDDKLYKFKEGDFKRLRIQDIKDMLLLLVQGKLTNLTVEERFAFNVSLRMFTRSIVIQQRLEDLQLGVESYQKKLNLTKPNTYRSDLKRKEAYTAYSNPRGFIYQNKDKHNRLMRIDKLYKFSDGTLNDVRTALDDRLKGIRMKYLPQTIWRKSDKERAAAMIQAIYKQLKTRRIMRSLEKFVGGRLYEGDFRMLQLTI